MCMCSFFLPFCSRWGSIVFLGVCFSRLQMLGKLGSKHCFLGNGQETPIILSRCLLRHSAVEWWYYCTLCTFQIIPSPHPHTWKMSLFSLQPPECFGENLFFSTSVMSIRKGCGSCCWNEHMIRHHRNSLTVKSDKRFFFFFDHTSAH